MPGRAHGSLLAYDEVRQQVPDRPLAAERRGVRADHEGRVAEALAFGLRERRHPPSLVSPGGVGAGRYQGEGIPIPHVS